MSRAEDVRITIRAVIEQHLRMNQMTIDATRARIKQALADLESDRAILEATEALLVGWRHLLDAQETPA